MVQSKRKNENGKAPPAPPPKTKRKLPANSLCIKRRQHWVFAREFHEFDTVRVNTNAGRIHDSYMCLFFFLIPISYY